MAVPGRAAIPPSTSMTLPLTKPAADDARYSAASAMSSVVPAVRLRDPANGGVVHILVLRDEGGTWGFNRPGRNTINTDAGPARRPEYGSSDPYLPLRLVSSSSCRPSIRVLMTH